jgi:hypothetical protein
MKILDDFNLSVTQCEMSDIIEESHRFLLHISLVHVLTYIIDGKIELFNPDIIKTLVVTAIAIIIYNIVFRKIIKSKLKKVKSACYINIYDDMNVEAVYGAK